MFSHQVKLRVRYSETDRMGYAYYGNYAQYYEVGRVEALRSLGINYRELEDAGILLPVYEYQIKYLKPAYYDDELTLTTSIKEMPGARIRFDYECHNEEGVLLNIGTVTLVFIDKASGKPRQPPADVLEKLKKHI